MKKFIPIATLLLSVTAHSADWQSFVVPESLGQNVDKLNAQYDLNLKRNSTFDVDKDTLAYTLFEPFGCGYFVYTNQNKDIQKISVSGEEDGCAFKTDNPIEFELNKTIINQLLSPIKKGTYNAYPTEYFIQPVCFDCPDGREVFDVLEISNVKEPFKLQFETFARVKAFQKEVAIAYLNLKKYNPKKHYDYMKKIEKKFAKTPDIYQSEKFKKIALKHYGDAEVFGYTLSLK